MNVQDFRRKYPKLVDMPLRYRYAFLALVPCMPPRPAQISKTALNRRAIRVSTSWALISKQTRSERITKLIDDYELFLADPVEPRFICMAESGEPFLLFLDEESKNNNSGTKDPSAGREDSFPDEEDV